MSCGKVYGSPLLEVRESCGAAGVREWLHAVWEDKELSHALNLLNCGDAEEAALEIRKEIADEPTSAQLHAIAAVIAIEVGDRDTEKRHRREAEQSTSDPFACFLNAWMYTRDENDGEAWRWIRKAAESVPDASCIHWLSACLHARAKNWDAALGEMRLAEEHFQQGFSGYPHYIELLQRAKRDGSLPIDEDTGSRDMFANCDPTWEGWRDEFDSQERMPGLEEGMPINLDIGLLEMQFVMRLGQVSSPLRQLLTASMLWRAASVLHFGPLLVVLIASIGLSLIGMAAPTTVRWVLLPFVVLLYSAFFATLASRNAITHGLCLLSSKMRRGMYREAKLQGMLGWGTMGVVSVFAWLWVAYRDPALPFVAVLITMAGSEITKARSAKNTSERNLITAWASLGILLWILLFAAFYVDRSLVLWPPGQAPRWLNDIALNRNWLVLPVVVHGLLSSTVRDWIHRRFGHR